MSNSIFQLLNVCHKLCKMPTIVSKNFLLINLLAVAPLYWPEEKKRKNRGNAVSAHLRGLFEAIRVSNEF